MIYNDKATTALKDINTLKLLKKMYDVQGRQEYVRLDAIERWKIYHIKEHMDKLIDLGYILPKRLTKTNDQSEVVITVTSDGALVCGFAMTTLLNFVDSQQD